MNRTQAADTRTELDLITEVEMFSHMDAGSFDEWADQHFAARTPVSCPDCDGEGNHLTLSGPGYPTDYGWTPHETETECRTCRGTGTAAFDDLTEEQMLAVHTGQVAS